MRFCEEIKRFAVAQSLFGLLAVYAPSNSPSS